LAYLQAAPIALAEASRAEAFCQWWWQEERQIKDLLG